MNKELDVNVLVNVYNQRIAQLANQNILLEAKLQQLNQDYQEDRDKLLKANLDLQGKYDKLFDSKKKSKVVDKYQKDTEFNE